MTPSSIRQVVPLTKVKGHSVRKDFNVDQIHDELAAHAELGQTSHNNSDDNANP